MSPRPKESRDNSLTYPHLNQRYDPPTSRLPKKKRKGFKYIKAKFLGRFATFGL